jgi:hypothetical protein
VRPRGFEPLTYGFAVLSGRFIFYDFKGLELQNTPSPDTRCVLSAPKTLSLKFGKVNVLFPAAKIADEPVLQFASFPQEYPPLKKEKAV